MRTRFWQKTYLFTLILCLLCINAVLLFLAAYTHRKNTESTESAAAAEQYYIAMCFERDRKDLLTTDPDADIRILMRSFGSFYAASGRQIAFEEDGNVLYSDFKWDYEVSPGTLTHTEQNGEAYLLISSPICDGKYTMIFARNITAAEKEFRSLIAVCVATGVGISVLLAVALCFILKKLSAPLERLKETTEAVKAGDLSVRAEVRGNDEFTLLAESFNSMLSTVRSQMDALDAEAKQKQRLVDDLAHELRTPLTSIRGYAEYLEKAAVTEEKRVVAAQYILSESERLRKISELLLDSAYFRENPPEMTETDLPALLTDTQERLKTKADESGVDLCVEPAPAAVPGNETLLSMLLFNLTENAIKACSPGGTVRLTCAGNTVTVRDDGKGMTEEQLAHVTEPFYRTDKSRSRAEGGAGLGLTLCRQITDLHGAVMTFTSEPGKGTEVTVTFPAPEETKGEDQA